MTQTDPKPPDARHILDNQTACVADYLRRGLQGADAFDLVSAYFSIYGYEMLAREMDAVARTRFLFGDPSSVSELDPGYLESKAFQYGEDGLSPTFALSQKSLAKRCEAWAKSEGVEIRSIRKANFLHGKMYLAGAFDTPSVGVVGSSNFTQRGLGGGASPNIEINLAVENPADLAELRAWFDNLWADDELTKDAKGEFMDALARLGMNYSPESVYYKTLLELFREDMDALAGGDADLESAGFSDSQIWRALYNFQKDGVKSVISKLRRHNGCILADSVGLGKTYTALAVIKYCESRNERVLVLCPKKLERNWSLYQAANNDANNPFPEDRFGYTLLAHTDLSRDRGMSGGIDLANFNWSNFDTVVIDESHNFRNDGGKRYERLLNEVIKGGARTKVLMLSATPVNTSLLDLRNQIYLMTEKRENAFSESLGVREIRKIMEDAQREFLLWEGGLSGGGVRDKARLMDRLGADFLRLLDGVSISRSRRQIERFYKDDLKCVGGFPKRETPVNLYPPTDERGELSYDPIAAAIERFELSIYLPINYRRVGATLRQIHTAENLIGMIRTNFLKRLESSPRSLALTLRRVIEKIDRLLEKIGKFQKKHPNAAAPIPPGVGLRQGFLLETPAPYEETVDEFDIPDGETVDDYVTLSEDVDDEDFVVSQKDRSFHFSELDVARWKADMESDRATLQGVLDSVKKVTPDRDGKLLKIRELIREKANNPTPDRDGKPNRKTLLFTTFKDTAIYLYDNLKAAADELDIGMAMVSGDLTRATVGENGFNDILSNFAPKARGRKVGGADIDLLIATDCISEGQNLQDCDRVINYDIHWNPVRIIQRFGRIDRIGGRSASVRMVNFWPTTDMDAYLRLQSRVRARMALADAAATGDANPLDEDAAARELQFRDNQLMRLKEEAIALEDLEDVPTLGDFTFGDFVAQLMRYLEANRAELEKMPPGVYAVADPEPNAAPYAANPGVIFCLRRRPPPRAEDAGANADTDAAAKPDADAKRDPREKVVSPKHPYYLVCVTPDGGVAADCANLRKTLAVFGAAAMGKAEALLPLCDAFDRQTKHGRDMALYNALLNAAVEDIRRLNDDVQINSIGMFADLDSVIPVQSDAPSGSADFELVTWLVIMGNDKG